MDTEEAGVISASVFIPQNPRTSAQTLGGGSTETRDDNKPASCSDFISVDEKQPSRSSQSNNNNVTSKLPENRFSGKLSPVATRTRVSLGTRVNNISMTKQSQRFYDEDIFTFKPKVSPQSVKLVENLGSDFMTRQKQHLEKQKKYFEQAALKTNGFYGRLSPVAYKNKKLRKDKQEKEPEPAEEETVISPEEETTHGDLSTPVMTGAVELGGLSSSDGGAINSQSSPLLSAVKPVTLKSPKSKSTTTVNQQMSDTDGFDGDDDGLDTSQIANLRNKGMTNGGKPSLGARRTSSLGNQANLERVKNAKLNAEKAMKNRRVFTIQGPYPAIRESLRQRGWVEKFYKLHMAPPPKRSPRNKKKPKTTTVLTTSDSDDDDDDDDGDDDGDGTDDDDDENSGKIPPWEEDNGIYGIMSRIVRNSSPQLVWCVRRDAVDLKTMKKEQMINHYGKATFTTKVGLCMNLRNTLWFEPVDPETFFPRCYRLSHDEEKHAFIDDYRLTMCVNILKWVVERSMEVGDGEELPSEEKNGLTSASSSSLGPSNKVNLPPIGDLSSSSSTSLVGGHHGQNLLPHQRAALLQQPKKKKGGPVPMRAVDLAMIHCERHVRFTRHDDLDSSDDAYSIGEADWEQLLQWYYKLAFEDGTVAGASARIPECESMLEKLKKIMPQFELDGMRNIWIVKPGAKSRGRGIICYDRLEDMLKLVSSTVVKKESKFVVQKYIERPLLIYNTKFDIRQWFLVTDWNPLTLWFYKLSYLRFCSQQFTLDNFDESIHLSNNAIQSHYSNGPRAAQLPDENMWSSDEFQDYLREKGLSDVWENVIYPGMKKAVTCSLFSAQDVVEYRKNGFELYGADFMLTEDYQPWLIEINSSPSMSYSTKVTEDLCARVLEDTIKVVLDRRLDKNADTGEFELAYKQPVVTVPPYIGINLTVEGQTVKRPAWMNLKKEENNSLSKIAFTPRLPGASNPAPPAAAPLTVSAPAAVPVPPRTNPSMEKIVKSCNILNPTTVAGVPSNNKLSSSMSSTNCNCPTTRTGPNVAVTGVNLTPTAKYQIPTLNLQSKSDVAAAGGSAVAASTDLSCSANVSSPANQPTVVSAPLCAKPSASSTVSAYSALGVAALAGYTGIIGAGVGTVGGGTSLSPTACRSPSQENTHTRLEGPSPDQKQVASRENVAKSRTPGQLDVTQKVPLFDRETVTTSTSLVEKQSLPMKSVGSMDLQEMSKGYDLSILNPASATHVRSDGAWGRTCKECGSGMNLKLDVSAQSPCWCQRDSVRIDPTTFPGSPRDLHTDRGTAYSPAPFMHQAVPPLPYSGNFAPFGYLPENHPYLAQTPGVITRSLNLPKRFSIDRHKLMASVCAKTDQASVSLSESKERDKIVLRYTDGGIQKPDMQARVPQNSFPKLVSRYVSRKMTKDGLPLYIESYKQNPKLTVVTQSFI